MPLFWLSLAFLSGILLAASLPLSRGFWLAALGIALLGLLLLWRLERARWLREPALPNAPSSAPSARLRAWLQGLTGRLPLPWWALLVALVAGAARFSLALPDWDDPRFIAHYNDRPQACLLEGVIVQPPDERDLYTQVRIAVDRIAEAEGGAFQPAEGLVLARLPPGGGWRYGNRLQVEGRLQTPPAFEDFSYRDYLARSGVHTLIPQAEARLLQRGQGNPLKAGIYAFKDRSLRLLHRLFPDPEAALLAGILLGVESGIPQPVRQAFNATGAAHIIAISGFNIAVLAGLFSWLFTRLFDRWRGAALSLLVIAIYTLLVGADAAVVRAAIMGGLALIAVQVGRRQNGLNSLAFVGAVMAFFNPHLLWDVGFQLSFAATLGLVLYAQPFTDFVVGIAGRFLPGERAQRLGGWVGAYFLFTVAAQLTTLPVIVYHFKRLSIVSLVANPVILPAQPAVMVLGGLALLGGWVAFPIGQVIAYLAWPFVDFTIRGVEWFAAWPGGALQLGSVSLVAVVLFYLVLFLLTLGWPRARGWLATLRPGVTLAALGAITLLVWRAVLAAPDGKLHLYLLEVSASGRSGEAVLVQTPSGRFVLLGGGPSANALSDALGRRLPLFHRRLDWLVIASNQEDQLTALPRMLERYPAQNAWLAATELEGYNGRLVREALAEVRLPQVVAQAGQALDLGDGAALRLIAVGESGGAFLLEWKDFRVLLPLGLDAGLLEQLQADASLGPLTAVLLAGGGDGLLNPPSWIEKLRPQVILISVAAGDRNGRPSPETLQALRGLPLLRTDLHGWIHLSTNGEQMWVEVERK